MKYKDLFLDFDDTLYDTYGNSVIALKELFEEKELSRYFSDPNVFYNAYWAANIDLWTRYSKGEITRDYLIVERFRRPLCMSEALKDRCDKDADAFVEYCLMMSDRFLELCSSKPGLVPGALDVMDYLKGRGYRMHMCSNGFHEVQYKKLRACGLTDYFDHVILSEDAGYNKPAAGFFDYAIKVSGAEKTSTLMIGDNFNTDILGAKHYGLATAYYNRFPAHPAPESVDYEVTALEQLKSIL